jgi:hypothetical protein
MRPRHRSPGVWPGLILIAVGGGLLGREFGYLPPHVRLVDFWPLFVVFMGISSLLHRRGFLGVLFSLAFIGLGALLLAGNLGFIAFPAARLWPALLVLVGLAFLLRRHPRGGWRGPPPPDPVAGDGTDTRVEHQRATRQEYGSQTTADDELHKQINFSGAQLRVESQAWKGGELNVTIGGVELDLRNARLHPDGAVLDLRVLMGGIDIRVPDTWQVYCEVTPLFGGADDTTRSTQGSADAPKLRILGTVTLGGVTVRN